jgi:hypothetical protein
MRYDVPQIHQCKFSAGVNSQNKYPSAFAVWVQLTHCITSKTVLPRLSETRVCLVRGLFSNYNAVLWIINV